MSEQDYETCDRCGGSGNLSEYDAEYLRCPECHGKGWVIPCD